MVRPNYAADPVSLHDLVEHVVAPGDVTAARVASVEVRLRRVGNEELRAAGVRPGERHAHGPAVVALAIDLVADDPSRPAVAVAPRIPVLDDEVRHHAVPAAPIEEAAVHEAQEIQHRERRVRGVQDDADVPTVGLDRHLGQRAALERREEEAAGQVPVVLDPAPRLHGIDVAPVLPLLPGPQAIGHHPPHQVVRAARHRRQELALDARARRRVQPGDVNQRLRRGEPGVAHVVRLGAAVRRHEVRKQRRAPFSVQEADGGRAHHRIGLRKATAGQGARGRVTPRRGPAQGGQRRLHDARVAVRRHGGQGGARRRGCVAAQRFGVRGTEAPVRVAAPPLPHLERVPGRGVSQCQQRRAPRREVGRLGEPLVQQRDRAGATQRSQGRDGLDDGVGVGIHQPGLRHASQAGVAEGRQRAQRGDPHLGARIAQQRPQPGDERLARQVRRVRQGRREGPGRVGAREVVHVAHGVEERGAGRRESQARGAVRGVAAPQPAARADVLHQARRGSELAEAPRLQQRHARRHIAAGAARRMALQQAAQRTGGGLPADLGQGGDHLQLVGVGRDGREGVEPPGELRCGGRVAQRAECEGRLHPHRRIGIGEKGQQQRRAGAVADPPDRDRRLHPDQRVGVLRGAAQRRDVERAAVLQ